MYAVGVVGITAGLLVAVAPRFGAYVVAAWLAGIILNLLTVDPPRYYDIALRDFGLMLGALTLACSLFAGYDMAARQRLNFLHAAGFALVVAVTVYVIVDLEYPRVGLIRMTDSDQVLADLRKQMD